jgi:coenzyme F420 hydrogenase subunit beta
MPGRLRGICGQCFAVGDPKLKLDEVQSTRWLAQWKELKSEVIDPGLCTGCAGCVISCPHDVIGYDHNQGGYKPFHIEDELGPDDCGHGQKGCTTCTRACPRYSIWEAQADDHLFGRVREPDEVAGIYSDILLTRASDQHVHVPAFTNPQVHELAFLWVSDSSSASASAKSSG